jgi:hypothetical protein
MIAERVLAFVKAATTNRARWAPRLWQHRSMKTADVQDMPMLEARMSALSLSHVTSDERRIVY